MMQERVVKPNMSIVFTTPFLHVYPMILIVHNPVGNTSPLFFYAQLSTHSLALTNASIQGVISSCLLRSG